MDEGRDPDAPDDAPGWTLMETDGGGTTGRAVGGLHEILLWVDPAARYRDAGSGQRHWGATLMAEGLALPPESASAFGSTLTRLVRLGRN